MAIEPYDIFKEMLKVNEGTWKTRYYTVTDVMELVGVSQTKAYQIIQRLNKELGAQGYIVIAGRIPRKYFDERFYGKS